MDVGNEIRGESTDQGGLRRADACFDCPSGRSMMGVFEC